MKSEAHAATTAEMMLETDLRGVDSHGVTRIPMYVRLLDAGDLIQGNSFATFYARVRPRAEHPILTAMNRMTPDTYDLVGTTKPEQIHAWLRQHCQQNPNQLMAVAVHALAEALHPQRVRMAPN